MTASSLEMVIVGSGVSLDSSESDRESRREREADVKLVRRAKDGDTAAFRALVEKFQNRVFVIALGVLGSREDAEDVVQEAFLKAYRNLKSFREQSSFYTWLYRIVFNLSVDLSRKRYRRSESPIAEAAVLDSVAQNSVENRGRTMAHLPGPDEQLQRSELRVRIKQAIAALSPEHRTVVLLREIEGLSYAEISEVVGCSKGTVMSRLHHARKRLQRSLQEHVPWEGEVKQAGEK